MHDSVQWYLSCVDLRLALHQPCGLILGRWLDLANCCTSTTSAPLKLVVCYVTVQCTPYHAKFGVGLYIVFAAFNSRDLLYCCSCFHAACLASKVKGGGALMHLRFSLAIAPKGVSSLRCNMDGNALVKVPNTINVHYSLGNTTISIVESHGHRHWSSQA